MSLSSTQVDAPEAAGKYLTFILGGEHYGIPILGVREIIAVQPITPLPRMPEAVEGVINLRGKIIPVIDLRRGLGLDAREHDRSTCIIVLDVEGLEAGQAGATHIGCIVDAVREVANIASEELQPPPSVGGQIQADYILALAKPEDQDQVVTLLDIPDVLTELFGSAGDMEAAAEGATS